MLECFVSFPVFVLFELHLFRFGKCSIDGWFAGAAKKTSNREQVQEFVQSVAGVVHACEGIEAL